MTSGDDRAPVVVITGVGRAGQVGEAIASHFAALGWQLVLLDRDAAELAARAAALGAAGASVTALPLDLTDGDAAHAAAARVRAERGPAVHALVCAAGGFAMCGPGAEASLDGFRTQMAISLLTAAVATQAFLPLLRVGGGGVVFFASAAVLEGGRVAGMSAYAAAKAGVLALMRAVAQEEAVNGVRANAVAPTSIRTAANEAAMGADGSYVERATVARAVQWLATTPSVTGQVLRLG
ncbi:MAG: SDR family NAD(P)-dependent oxidoreductase [Gemmatimonadota bacterium]